MVDRDGSRPRKRSGLFRIGVTLIGAALPATAAGASPSFCIDKGNPFFAIDRAVATAVAHADHTTPRFTVIDTRVGADSLNAQTSAFFARLASKCDLVMGFPVETGYPTVPEGVKATTPYAATGFVLAAPGRVAPSFASLAPHTTVGVTYLTVPSTYFDHGHGATLASHQYSSPAALYHALEAKQVAVALMWQPWLVRELAQSHAAIAQHQLHLPHARWRVVALYRPDHAAEAVRFDAAIHRMTTNGRLASLIAPYQLPH